MTEQAVFLCGGLGTRLRPLTYDIPKPMMPFGDKPFLEILVEQFKAQGQKAYENWQATAEKIVNAQMDLVNMWMPTQPESATNGKTSTKKTAKK